MIIFRYLPMQKPTSFADESLSATKDEAYNIDGKHPFAIDIPILGFIQPKETNPIEKEYPAFSSWVEKKCGATDSDWYTKHNAK